MIETAKKSLPLAYFGLMCIGLMLASYFLQSGKLTGSEWVAMCGILFGADRLADVVRAKV